MKVLLHWEDTVLVARLWEMEVPDTLAMQEAFQIIAETEPQHVVIDCSQLAFIASNGIAGIIKLIQHIRRHGGRARLAAVPPQVERILELVNLRNWVPFSPSIAEALATIRPAVHAA